ncbi:NAD(P)-dependent dehydrogenase (short-subunit alcohol dehydrogenase family) [Collimonas sp. PA-H2]|uniref:SDR family NAD(P)-dependent oxidoreductase n=1 Tax=Collimonas sp. PA-H2 TaxID=1881062 RepID=UPI000BF346D6|nr:SDR family NAD(P)-dependent oxidoreductase [Collimonas sp. PA-H2]PFH10144.1 NAD(P)-dependent dehydrogenase (short-subunit alcohol dehydrogenase family) [Collimonas sp. PA-H2]
MPTRNAPDHAVALITDAASAVGRAIALALARQGWQLALHHQEEQAPATLTALLQECQALGVKAVAVRCCLDDEKDIAALLPAVAVALGAVRCLVNNASHIEHDSAAAFSPAGLARHMQINLAAPLQLAQELHAATLKNPGTQAVVINLLDQKLFNPQPDFLSYTLSKAALHSATTLLAQAFAPQVRVAGIAPALPAADSAIDPAALEDIAATVCFVAASSAITGSTLLVDGGRHLHPHPRDKSGAPGPLFQPH